MKLYNTLGRQLQDFNSLNPAEVKIYTCGPTVYDYQHIGNYSGYIYWDILVRLLMSDGHTVNRVMNITDVGHLASDGDEGEDKLEKGAHREGKSAREVADFYTKDFFQSFNRLNLIEPETYAKATSYIPQQLEIIQQLIDKEYAYKTDQAIYFDITKLDDYGKLTGQKLSDKEIGARSEVITDKSKHHPQDFALWFFTTGRFADHEMRWDSPWGSGFPGWHLECSAIVHATLGEPVDIHTGGIDHIGTHHTNEIAQTEAAFDTKLSNFWLHNNHMMVDGKKISKSLGNGYTLKDLGAKGFSPMDFRLLVLQSHYRSQSTFTWELLNAAQNRLKRYQAMADLRFQPVKKQDHKSGDVNFENIINEIKAELQNDIGTPQALSRLDSLTEIQMGSISQEQQESFTNFIMTLDQLLGLSLLNSPDITDEQKSLVAQRETARQAQDWTVSDQIRIQLQEQGIELNDTPNGAIWSKS